MNNEIKLPPVPNVPLSIDTGFWTSGHIQGIAVDPVKGFIYYSFTTILAKADLNGNVIGYVKGLTGHLGCISFNPEDGKVYGSIEYKHDSIGQGIMKMTGRKLADEDAFYVAIFDVDKIDRKAMDAEQDQVMKAVYLPDVVNDFNGTGENGQPHKYACSGIDGTGFGPAFGQPKDSPLQLFIAYGIYNDVERNDNDHQVIVQYDWRKFDEVAEYLNQDKPHHSGINCENKFFLYTGNTVWGVQNLEYDAFTDTWITAVYRGKKPQYRNPPMYLIDRSVAPYKAVLRGLNGEEGLMLTLKQIGVEDTANGVWGNDFPEGQTGVYAFGNGYYYYSFNDSRRTEDSVRVQWSNIYLYKWTGEAPYLYERVEENK